jgi:molybdenum cofactor biosynthesis enzyme MoaA
MKKIKITDLKGIHLELSSYCNLKCPFCARQDRPDPLRMNKNLSKKAIDNLFIDELVVNLEDLTMCGSFGEPTLNPNLPYILGKMNRLNPDCHIFISTNGSTHTNEWWYHFGKCIKKLNLDMCFCLDGFTKETNKYRDSDVEKVLIHIENYLRGTGGKNAELKTILFEHNQHEIEKFQEYTDKRNMKYTVKHSWDYDNEYRKATIDIDAEEIYNPTCSFINKGYFYVSAIGEVLPCCYYVEDFYKYPQLLLEDYTIKEIVESASFNVLLLHINKSIECRKHCGI